MKRSEKDLPTQQPGSHLMSDGDEVTWLYARIYCDRAQGDNILLNLLAPLKQLLLDQQLIKGFFFVRFFEGGHHLRVRFCGKKSHLLGPVRASLNGHVNQYFTQRGFPLQQPLDGGPNGMDDQLWKPRLPKSTPRPVPSYEYDRYEPEIDRYGGESGLQVSERHFCHSSDTALQVLDLERKGAGSRRNAAFLLLDALATAFHLTNQQKALAFEEHFLYWMASRWCTSEHAALFAQEHERHRLALSRLLASGESRSAQSNSGRWMPVIRAWREAAGEICDELASLESQKLLTVAHVEPMFSYMHMLCNRLGLFPREEAYLVYLLFRHYAEQAGSAPSQTGPYPARVSESPSEIVL